VTLRLENIPANEPSTADKIPIHTNYHGQEKNAELETEITNGMQLPSATEEYQKNGSISSNLIILTNFVFQLRSIV
jgi:hypothetical protein